MNQYKTRCFVDSNTDYTVGIKLNPTAVCSFLCDLECVWEGGGGGSLQITAHKKMCKREYRFRQSTFTPHDCPTVHSTHKRTKN